MKSLEHFIRLRLQPSWILWPFLCPSFGTEVIFRIHLRVKFCDGFGCCSKKNVTVQIPAPLPPPPPSHTPTHFDLTRVYSCSCWGFSPPVTSWREGGVKRLHPITPEREAVGRRARRQSKALSEYFLRKFSKIFKATGLVNVRSKTEMAPFV